MPIEDFLMMVSRATGKNLIWNPADKNIRGKKIKGSVELEAKVGELFPLVRSLLTFYELIMIPVGPGRTARSSSSWTRGRRPQS